MLLFLIDLINIEIFRISFSFFYSFSLFFVAELHHLSYVVWTIILSNSEEARQFALDVCRLPSTEQSHDQEQVFDTVGCGTVQSIEKGRVLHQTRLVIRI